VQLRLTTRQLMVIVAMVGLALACGIEGARLRRLSKVYALQARINNGVATIYQKAADQGRLETYCVRCDGEEIQDSPSPARRVKWRTISAHYIRLRQKYERAARCPWLSISPDPPEPELCERSLHAQ
jgi:hypothetical protein